LQDSVPQLDDARRAQQQFVNSESAKHAGLAARMEALKALQDKVKTDGKLKPWLAKHGLDGLAGLWSKIHIEQGWENALEGALRERLGALEVSRLDMVRGLLRPLNWLFTAHHKLVCPKQKAKCRVCLICSDCMMRVKRHC
jgi:chromosome segregation protein